MKKLTAFIITALLSVAHAATVTSISVLPRQDNADSRIKTVKVESSNDSLTWTPITEATFANSAIEKTITFATPITAKYFRLVATASQSGNINAGIAELNFKNGTDILPRDNWSVSADSENAAIGNLWGPASYAIDGNKESFWFTKWPDGGTPYPHTFTVNTEKSAVVVPDVTKEVSLVWNKNPENNIDHYVIQYKNGDNAAQTVNSVDFKYTFPSLGIGVWTFAVKAVNTANLESPLSDSVSVTISNVSIPTPPSMPTGVKVTIIK